MLVRCTPRGGWGGTSAGRVGIVAVFCFFLNCLRNFVVAGRYWFTYIHFCHFVIVVRDYFLLFSVKQGNITAICQLLC